VLRILEIQGLALDSRTDGETNKQSDVLLITFATIATVIVAYVTNIRIAAYNQLGGLRSYVASTQNNVHSKDPFRSNKYLHGTY
jgi:hypothetical protein